MSYTKPELACISYTVFLMCRKKLNDGLYRTKEMFMADMDLMCQNCKMYNPPDSVFYKLAHDIKRLCMSCVSRVCHVCHVCICVSRVFHVCHVCHICHMCVTCVSCVSWVLCHVSHMCVACVSHVCHVCVMCVMYVMCVMCVTCVTCVVFYKLVLISYGWLRGVGSLKL